MFDTKPILQGIENLRARGTPLAEGLTDTEIEEIETRFQFVFPPELRFFLQEALPVSDYYVDWRGDENELARWFDRPIDGILFDVQHNNYWHADWGTRPAGQDEAASVAAQHLAKVPKLIPIGDRLYMKCIPAIPNAWGNPVFSINQCDILHAGRDFGDYLRWFSRPHEEFERDEEMGVDPTPCFCEAYRPIPFWTELTRWNTGA